GLALVVAVLPAAGAPPSDADMLAPFPHPKGYVCYRAPSPVTIDGALTDAAWDAAPWTDAFVDIEGDKRPKPRFRTRVKMLWDGDQWRINFSRVEWDTEVADGKYRKVKDRPEHNWVWSPQGVIDMHRPERWGYLQFSTAKPGKAEFRPDPEWERRDLLHRVYYAQRAYRKANGKYTVAVADLGLKDKNLDRLSL